MAVPILVSLSASHMMNDTMQSVIQALYPMFAESYQLSYGQIGLITLAFQLTASILQPLVGLYTDRRPLPYSLTAGMGSTLIGLLLLSRANSFLSILGAAALVGVGSSVFHPESSRVARMASGGRFGFAQALFQVGGNTGTSLGPLLAAFVVVPLGQHSVGYVSLIALVGMAVLFNVGRWYSGNLHRLRPKATRMADGVAELTRGKGAAGAGDPDGTDVLEVRLSRESRDIFHLLPDPQVRGFGARCADRTCSCSLQRVRSARSWAARSATGSAAST